ncbi:MAG: PorP/SprF family type IX secretion system membrane protein [Bacteroidales bacterium]
MKINFLVLVEKGVLIICLVVLGQRSFAQQLPLYDQYLYNKFLIDPAHAGSDGFTSFNMTVRKQWIGYSGSPTTCSISWQTRILKRGYKIKKNIFDQTKLTPKNDGKVGLGGYIFSDRNGLVQRTGFQATYSYHMWLKKFTQISLGLAFSGYHFIINANELSFADRNEPWLNNNLRRGVFVPDMDFGIYLLNPRFDFGFSALQLFGAATKIGDNAYRNFRMYRHFYTFGSCYLGTGGRTEFDPSLLFKISEQLKPQADIGITYVYDQRLWLGLTYRTGGGLIANMRCRYIPDHSKWAQLFFGYAIDLTLNEIQSVTYGTHELTVALKFGDSSRKYRWLDRF